MKYLKFNLIILLIIIFQNKAYPNSPIPFDTCDFRIVKYSEKKNLLGIYQGQNGNYSPMLFRLYDIKNKKFLNSINIPFYVDDFIFSNDSKYVALISNHNLIIRNLETNKSEKNIILDKNISHKIYNHEGGFYVKKIIFNPIKNYELSVLYSNGSILIIDTKNNKRKAFNLLTKKREPDIKEPDKNEDDCPDKDGIKSSPAKLSEIIKTEEIDYFNIEYSNDGKKILTTDGYKTFLVLDYNKGEIIKKMTLTGNKKNKIIDEFSYDIKKNELILCSKDGYFHKSNINFSNKIILEQFSTLSKIDWQRNLYGEDRSIINKNSIQSITLKEHNYYDYNKLKPIINSYISILDIKQNKIIQRIECKK
ncbi:MAG: hypothetical protein AABZ74_11980 [Cyanobacteriota bacterium]